MEVATHANEVTEVTGMNGITGQFNAMLGDGHQLRSNMQGQPETRQILKCTGFGWK